MARGEFQSETFTRGIKRLYDYNFFIKYMLYKNAHDRTIFIFLKVIIFLKIGCTNLDAASISPLLPYGQRNFQNNLKIGVGHFFVAIYNILKRKMRVLTWSI